MRVEGAFAIHTPVGVCAEIIALGLRQIGRQAGTAVGILDRPVPS